MCRFAVQRRNNQYRLLSADQQQAQKPLMRVAGKAGQIVYMLGISYEQGIQPVTCHSLLQAFQSLVHFRCSPFVYTLKKQRYHYRS
ncbi:hypothetical protein D3C80_1963440 [compost metagenome]